MDALVRGLWPIQMTVGCTMVTNDDRHGIHGSLWDQDGSGDEFWKIGETRWKWMKRWIELVRDGMIESQAESWWEMDRKRGMSRKYCRGIIPYIENYGDVNGHNWIALIPCMKKPKRNRQKERETDRQTERDRERQRDSQSEMKRKSLTSWPKLIILINTAICTGAMLSSLTNDWFLKKIKMQGLKNMTLDDLYLPPPPPPPPPPNQFPFPPFSYTVFTLAKFCLTPYYRWG